MQFKNKANEQTQTIDGRTIWLSRSVAVVSQVIIRHLPTNRYRTVIIKRGPASLGSIGEWCFPCGYLDYDETSFEAAIRETFEETGIDLISLQQQAHMDSDITPRDSPWNVDSTPTGRQNVCLSHCFYFETNASELPSLSNLNCEYGEVDEILWVDIEHVMDKTFTMAFEHDLLAIKLMTKLYR